MGYWQNKNLILEYVYKIEDPLIESLKSKVESD